MGNPSGRLGGLGFVWEARIVNPRYRVVNLCCRENKKDQKYSYFAGASVSLVSGFYYFINEHERDASASGGSIVLHH